MFSVYRQGNRLWHYDWVTSKGLKQIRSKAFPTPSSLDSLKSGEAFRWWLHKTCSNMNSKILPPSSILSVLPLKDLLSLSGSLILGHFNFLKDLFVSLKGRFTGKTLKREIGLPSASSPPQMAATARAATARAKAARAGPGWNWEPDASWWSPCFPRYINRELDQRGSSQDLIWCSKGMPASQLVAKPYDAGLEADV